VRGNSPLLSDIVSIDKLRTAPIVRLMLAYFIDRTREDSLTATVISNLLHLPFEVYWRILRNACHTEGLPENPGEPDEVEFWPHWDARETTNERFVEPDVFLRFKDFDLIIEAKRWDRGQQDRSQWERELAAYATEYGKDCKDVCLLALGGIHGQSDDAVTYTSIPAADDGAEAGHSSQRICPVHMCEWSRMLKQCKLMERELAKLAYPTSQSRAHRRILRDVIQLFTVHNFQAGSWYEETLQRRARLSVNTEASSFLFRSIHIRFKSPLQTP